MEGDELTYCSLYADCAYEIPSENHTVYGLLLLSLNKALMLYSCQHRVVLRSSHERLDWFHPLLLRQLVSIAHQLRGGRKGPHSLSALPDLPVQWSSQLRQL